MDIGKYLQNEIKVRDIVFAVSSPELREMLCRNDTKSGNLRGYSRTNNIRILHFVVKIIFNFHGIPMNITS